MLALFGKERDNGEGVYVGMENAQCYAYEGLTGYWLRRGVGWGDGKRRD